MHFAGWLCWSRPQPIVAGGNPHPTDMRHILLLQFVFFFPPFPGALLGCNWLDPGIEGVELETTVPVVALESNLDWESQCVREQTTIPIGN